MSNFFTCILSLSLPGVKNFQNLDLLERQSLLWVSCKTLTTYDHRVCKESVLKVEAFKQNVMTKLFPKFLFCTNYFKLYYTCRRCLFISLEGNLQCSRIIIIFPFCLLNLNCYLFISLKAIGKNSLIIIWPILDFLSKFVSTLSDSLTQIMLSITL